MGLIVSHGAWDGPYGAFSEWQKALAIAAGNPPLSLMQGWFKRGETLIDPLYTLALAASLEGGWGGTYAAGIESELYAGLPIRWDSLREDPLNILLKNSGGDGEIPMYRLVPLAGRLEFLTKNAFRGLCWVSVF